MPWVREDNKEASCCGKTCLILTCTEVCQVGVSETQQCESRGAVQQRENDLPPKAASEEEKWICINGPSKDDHSKKMR